MQTLHRIGLVLSRLFCFMSMILLFISFIAAGILTFSLGDGDLSMRINGFLEARNSNAGNAAAAFAALFLISLGEIFLSRYASSYFRAELDAGTPFEKESASRLMKLGFLTILVSLLTRLVMALLYRIVFPAELSVPLSATFLNGSLPLGIMFLIISLLCRYGSEIQGRKEGQI